MSEELKPLSVEEVETIEANYHHHDPMGLDIEILNLVPRLLADWRRYRAALEDQVQVTSDAARTCVRYKAALEEVAACDDPSRCAPCKDVAREALK